MGNFQNLAKLVHDHTFVAYHFDLRVLVTLYEEITQRRILFLDSC